METIKTIAKINDVEIKMISDDENRVALKHLCDAIGVNYSSQYEKLKEDEILGPFILLRGMKGSDGRNVNMVTIPYKYVFGWLFTINPKNVNEDIRENVKKYRMECYDILFRHFSEQSQFLEEKQELINRELDEYNKIQEEFKTAKKRLDEKKKKLDEARKMTIDDWKEKYYQTRIEFPEDKKEQG